MHDHTREEEALLVSSDAGTDVHSLRIGHAQHHQAQFGQPGHVTDKHKGQGNKGVSVNKSSCFQIALVEQPPTLEGIHKIGGTIGRALGCALELVSSGGKLLCCCICCALKCLLKVINDLLSILRKLICTLLDLISSL